MELFLNAMSDYSIEDENGNSITVEQAKRYLDEGIVTNSNYSFIRFQQNNFDLEATKAYYDEQKRIMKMASPFK
jgi:hypothetical protein